MCFTVFHSLSASCAFLLFKFQNCSVRAIWSCLVHVLGSLKSARRGHLKVPCWMSLWRTCGQRCHTNWACVHQPEYCCSGCNCHTYVALTYSRFGSLHRGCVDLADSLVQKCQKTWTRSSPVVYSNLLLLMLSTPQFCTVLLHVKNLRYIQQVVLTSVP